MSEANAEPLPSGWSLATLGSVTKVDVGQNGPKSQEMSTYIDIGCVDNRLKRIVNPDAIRTDCAPSRAKQNLQSGDVLVSMTRPNLNSVALVSREHDGAIGSTGFHVLRADGVEPRWLFYGVLTNPFI